jgi:hypothetical protein
MRRNPRTPRLKSSGSSDDARPERFPSPESYLVNRRCAEVANLIVRCAKVVVEVLPGYMVAQLNPSERKRAARAARVLAPLLARTHPGTVFTLRFVSNWDKAPTGRGRRVGLEAMFARGLLMLSAGELGARDLLQLTVTELIAAAAAASLATVSWSDRRELFDRWRKIYRQGLPNRSSELVAEARKRLHAQRKREADRRAGKFDAQYQMAMAQALRTRRTAPFKGESPGPK